MPILSAGARAGLFLLSLALASAPLTVRAESPRVERLAPLLQASPFPGGCVARVSQGEVELQRAFGWADVAARRPYTLDTLQPVGSVSKTVIGLALMQAQAQGLVQLDEPVDRWLDFPLRHPQYPQARVTLRQLAQHTSGLLDTEAGYGAAYERGRTQPRQSLGDFLKAYLQPGGRLYRRGHFAPEAPGSAFHYSNIGSALAAYVIERASGMSYADYSRAQVLRPLGLSDSSWWATPAQAERAAALYSPERRPYPPYVLATYPDGGLRSSCAELTRYLQAWARAQAGADEAHQPLAGVLRAAMQPQFDEASRPVGLSSREPNQGLFFTWRADGSVGHTGSDDGVSVFVFLDPRRGVGRLFMTNVDLGADPTLGPSFAAIWKALGD